MLVALVLSGFYPAQSLVAAASKGASTRSLKPRGEISSQRNPRAYAELGKLPLYFEPNVGQADPAVRFISRGGGFTAFLTGKEVVLQNSKLTQPLLLRFSGAQAPLSGELEERLPGISNYFYGKDPTKWRTNIPHYQRARFRQIYPGIDVVFYSGSNRLEYDFIVAPHADPAVIGLSWEGADAVRLDDSGDLVLQTSRGEIRQRRPVVYQTISGKRVGIPCSYSLKRNGSVRFALAPWNRNYPLVIDPQIFYSTFLGGSGEENVGGIAADPAGSVYVVGVTSSTNFPLLNPFQAAYGDRGDGFVTKIAIGGGSLVYSTYLGGEFLDAVNAVTADSAGNAYLTGLTGSFGFPVTQNVFQRDFSGVQDAFVVKLSPFGNNLVFSTYLGTSDTFEAGLAIVLDRSNNPTVAGTTNSATFPVTEGAFDRSQNGGDDVFVTKFDSQGRQLIFSTFLGGSLRDTVASMTTDPAGDLYLAGTTSSPNFPVTPGAFDTTYNGVDDAFFAKLSQTGQRLIFSSYLGGEQFDEALGIAVEPGGRILLTGETSSTAFPTTPEALQRNLLGISEAFVARFSSNGEVLIASTLLGSVRREFGRSVLAGEGGHPIVVGYSESNNFPTTPGAFGVSANFFGDVFFAILRPLAEGLRFSSVFPGSFTEEPRAMAADAAGEIYIAGRTNSPDFITTANVFDRTYNQGIDAFVSRLTNLDLTDCVSTVSPTATTYEGTGGAGGVGVTGLCNWWAFRTTPWITIVGSPLQQGSGALNYTVAPYSGQEPRMGAIHVASNWIHILQKGSTTTPPFQDVPVTDPFVDFIRIIKNNAVTSGCAPNAYCPNENTTRGQMAVFIVRSLLGTDNFLFPPQPFFEDVPPSHPQYRWIQKLRELGITTGCNLIQFCPNDPVTRGQMAAFLVRAKFGSNFTFPTTPYFQDVSPSNLFFSFIQKLRQVGITTGCTPTQFCPNDNTTRGQMAVFLSRMFFSAF
ncbi:MAG: SBBP repeat-containing protein [Bryobacteraceae bacterium]|nr:SBBP repeat-containing protein [Bryobacteraceae bacterium]MDW8378949.1 SBBP repeat-containing protein [Bryobacterales bacterium]